jgi:small GTP-binding protein
MRAIVCLGDADHGKSTLIAALTARAKRRAGFWARQFPTAELAHVVDRLVEERERGMTIEAGEVRLEMAQRQLALIDVPGQEELLRNMAGAASRADAALVAVDVSCGPTEQTWRHLDIAMLFGIRPILVVATKIDLRQDLSELVHRVRARAGAFPVIAVSAFTGQGLDQLEAALESIPAPPVRAAALLRVHVQDRAAGLSGSWLLGRVQSGVLRAGAPLVATRHWQTWRPARILRGLETVACAVTGDSVAIEASELPATVGRGELLTNIGSAPPPVRFLTIKTLWLGDARMQAGAVVQVTTACQRAQAHVTRVRRQDGQTSLARGELGTLSLALDAPVVVDSDGASGRVAFWIDGRIVGGGIAL